MKFIPFSMMATVKTPRMVPSSLPLPPASGTAARYMAWIGERLQAAPEQYLWVHRRFKTRPPGEPSVYR